MNQSRGQNDLTLILAASMNILRFEEQTQEIGEEEWLMDRYGYDQCRIPLEAKKATALGPAPQGAPRGPYRPP